MHAKTWVHQQKIRRVLLTKETTFEHARLMQLTHPMNPGTNPSFVAIVPELKLCVLVLVTFVKEEHIWARLHRVLSEYCCSRHSRYGLGLITVP